MTRLRAIGAVVSMAVVIGAGDASSSANQAHGAAPSATVEVLAPGTRFETPVVLVEGPLPGPTVIVLAGIHGDEVAPPVAARTFERALRLDRGRVYVVAEVNRPALAAGTRWTPGEINGDLNRSFPTPARPRPRGELAAEIWRLVETVRPDYLVDLHEGWDFHRRYPKSVGSTVTIVPGVDEVKTRALAEGVIRAVDRTVDAKYKRFTLISPGPSGSVARSVAETLDIPTFVFETTRLTQTVDKRAGQQAVMVGALLDGLGMTGT